MPATKFNSLEEVRVSDVVYWAQKRKRKAEEDGADEDPSSSSQLAYVSPSEKIRDCLKMMGEVGVLSVPVIENYRVPQKETYHGMLDIMIISNMLVERVGNVADDKDLDRSAVLKDILDLPVRAVKEAKETTRLMPENDVAHMDDSLPHAIRYAFTRFAYHRLTIFDRSGNGAAPHAVGVLTQNDVLLFLDRFPNLLGPQAAKTLEALGLCSYKVTRISETATVLEAFRMMYDSHCRELAVVDSEGKAIGAFNMGVMRGLTEFADYGQTLKELAEKIPLKKVETCARTDTLAGIVAKVAASRPIRLYGLDSSGRPEFVITLNNLLSVLVNSGWELKDVTVKDVLERVQVNTWMVNPTFLDYDLTLGEALKRMGEQQRVSAPVIDHRGRFFGMVDTNDILYAVMDTLDENYRGTLRETETAANLYSFSMTDRSIIDDVFKRPLRSLEMVNKVQLKEGDLVWEVMRDVFLKHHYYCLAVQDKEGKVARCITQRDLARFVFHFPDILGETGQRTIQELGLVSGFVRAVNQREPTMEAFRVMRELGLPAVPVVNSTGKLVTYVDANDLRGMTNFYGLRLMISFFKCSVPNPEDYSPDSIPVPMPVTCSASETLQAVMIRMVETNAQRVWCVDEDTHPITVITLEKIFQILLQPPAVQSDAQSKFVRV